jgi:hypothetical protein
MDLKFLGFLLKEKNNKFLLASVKHPLILKIVRKAAFHDFCSDFSFTVTSRFYPVYVQCRTYHSQLLEQFSISQRTTFNRHKRLPESRNKLHEKVYWKDFHN